MEATGEGPAEILRTQRPDSCGTSHRSAARAVRWPSQIALERLQVFDEVAPPGGGGAGREDPVIVLAHVRVAQPAEYSEDDAIATIAEKLEGVAGAALERRA